VHRLERLSFHIADATLVVECDGGRPMARWQARSNRKLDAAGIGIVVKNAIWAEDFRALVCAWGRGENLDPKRIAAWLPKEPPFLAACWRAAIQIPIGETRTYSWLAAAAGRPTAHRAAAHAMARNPLALLVPCHRVVGTNDMGGFCGYKPSTLRLQSSHWALTLKNRLLQIESGNQIENRKVSTLPQLWK
jgi:O-6-methylguanine DNA methyltransferase